MEWSRVQVPFIYVWTAQQQCCLLPHPPVFQWPLAGTPDLNLDLVVGVPDLSWYEEWRSPSHSPLWLISMPTNCHKLSYLGQKKIVFLQSSEIHWWMSRCQQDWIPFGSANGQAISLPVPGFRAASSTCGSFLHLQSKNLASSSLSLHPSSHQLLSYKDPMIT